MGRSLVSFSGPDIQRQKGTPKNLCAKEFAELSGELSVRFASKPLFYWAVPRIVQKTLLVLFVRYFGFGVLFWALDFLDLCDLLQFAHFFGRFASLSGHCFVAFWLLFAYPHCGIVPISFLPPLFFGTVT